jgi:CopG family transcriptional regulator / antitoxin EndoAI
MAGKESGMSTTTVNISFKEKLLADIDKVAKQESRSRSELLREAVRMYIEHKMRWEKIFAFGEMQVMQKGLSETDVGIEIDAYRRNKSRK